MYNRQTLTLRQISDLKMLRELYNREAPIESVVQNGQELTVRFMDAVALFSETTLGQDRASDMPRPSIFKVFEAHLDCGSIMQAKDEFAWLKAMSCPFSPQLTS